MADIKISQITSTVTPTPSGLVEVSVPTPSGYQSRAVEIRYVVPEWTVSPSGHLLPNASGVQNIGSPQYPVKHMYVAPSSLFIGSKSLTNDNGVLKFGGAPADGSSHANLQENTNPPPSGTIAYSIVDVEEYASGGSESLVPGEETVHIFNSGDNFTVTKAISNAQILVVGGGGGGGSGFNNDACGGGGGAGAYILTTHTFSPGTYPVVVGAGGSAGTGNGDGGTGGDSSIDGVIANGGGGGTTFDRTPSYSGNGSGGGAGGAGESGDPGASGGLYGNSGGSNAGTGVSNNTTSCGGGGGAGGSGGNGVTSAIGGSGGLGLSSDISGTLTDYAGGGGGGARAGGGTASHGGGAGGAVNGNGYDGTANTGGGGGGGTSDTVSTNGGAGGSGVVIVRYSSPVVENQYKAQIQNIRKVESYEADTDAGYGSTNTKIPYFTNVRKNTISSFGSVENSSVNGWSFTASKNCEIVISCWFKVSGSVYMTRGISKNSSSLTTNVYSIPITELMAMAHTSNIDSYSSSVSVPLVLQSGDVIRVHGDGSAAYSSSGGVRMTVRGI